MDPSTPTAVSRANSTRTVPEAFLNPSEREFPMLPFLLDTRGGCLK